MAACSLGNFFINSYVERTFAFCFFALLGIDVRRIWSVFVGGAVEIRRLYVKKWAAEVVREMFDIPNCLALICFEKAIRHPVKGVSLETRYYISSLDPDVLSASEFHGYILEHGYILGD